MDPSCFVSTVQARGGGVMVCGDIFLAHFGPLSTNWASFKHHSLPEYCCWPCPSLYDYSVPIFWCYFQQHNAPSQSSNHPRLVSWTYQCFHFTQMASTVTRSQSSRAPLGCGGTGDSHHGCAATFCKFAATVWCYHINMYNISEECFQHLVETMPRRIKAVLKAKWESNLVLARCT